MAASERSQVRVIVKSLTGLAAKAVRVITLDVTANLIEDTPVDTGWAQSNWVPEIGSFFDGTVGTRDNVETGTQQAGAVFVAATYTLDKGFISISNNVPYIVNLNEGSSKRVPAGFVQAAILRAVQEVRI